MDATVLPLLIAPTVLALFVAGLAAAALRAPVRAWRGGATVREAIGHAGDGAKVLLGLLGFLALQGAGIVGAIAAAEIDNGLAAVVAVLPVVIMGALAIVSTRRRHHTLDAATRAREDAETREHFRLALVVVPVMIASIAAPELGDDAWLWVGFPFVALIVGAGIAWHRGDRATAKEYGLLLLLTPLLIPVTMVMTWWEMEAPSSVVFLVQVVVVAPVLLLGAGVVALFRWVSDRRAPLR